MSDWRTLTLAAVDAADSLSQPTRLLRVAVAVGNPGDALREIDIVLARLWGVYYLDCGGQAALRDGVTPARALEAVEAAQRACRDAKRLPLAECGRRLDAKMREAG